MIISGFASFYEEFNGCFEFLFVNHLFFKGVYQKLHYHYLNPNNIKCVNELLSGYRHECRSAGHFLYFKSLINSKTILTAIISCKTEV